MLIRILAVYAVVPALLLLVASRGREHSPSEGFPLPIAMTMGGLSILGSIVMAMSQLRPEVPPRRFFALSLTSLAMAELCSLLGFITQLTGSSPMWPFAGATWAVLLLVIAPRALALDESQSPS